MFDRSRLERMLQGEARKAGRISVRLGKRLSRESKSVAATARCLHLYRKYSAYTMIPRNQFIDRLLLVQTVRGDGLVVECGTWKGGMVAAMADLTKRRAVLFDSFEGLPEAKQIDGERAIAWQKNTAGEFYFDNCTADERDAIEAMRRSGAEYEIHKGWFNDTVPGFAAEERPIAVLHLDGDWYDSTLVCLEHLFPRVVVNGLVLVDDYGGWDGCTRAVHDYLSRTKATEAIGRSAHGVAYLRKRG